MGAHAIPEEYKGNSQGYMEELFKMLPIIKERKLAEFW